MIDGDMLEMYSNIAKCAWVGCAVAIGAHIDILTHW